MIICLLATSFGRWQTTYGCIPQLSFNTHFLMLSQALQSIPCRHEKTCTTISTEPEAADPSRRDALLRLSIAVLSQQSLAAEAAERRGIGRYIKKKALDPLVT